MTCAAKLLAYCVAEDHGYPLPTTGVRGAPVRTMIAQSLACVYSPLIPPQEFGREDALSFHSVLKMIFDRQAIIPFRFPTLLQNEVDLQAHLSQKAVVYTHDLKRLRDLVQMELRFTVDKVRSKGATSGTEYLQSKQQRSRTLQSSSQRARAALGELLVEWKERPTDQGLRCYALVKRADSAAVNQRVEAAQIAGAATVLFSGPWPATEFLHDEASKSDSGGDGSRD